MRDNLVSRVKRLVSGGIVNIVDAVENASPETVMKEAIREVDGAIDQVRHELGEVIAAKHLANRRLNETNTRHEELSAQILAAVDQSRDDLAEAAIARQLDLESQIPVIESTINDAAAQEAELESYISALQARRREMEEELSAVAASRNAAASGAVASAGPEASDAETTASRAESAFDRVMSATTGLPGTGSADRHSAAKLAELEKLSRDNRVHERLAALKATREKEGG